MKRFLLGFLVSISIAVSAEDIVWNGNTDFIEIGDRLEVFKDPDGKFSLYQIIDSAAAGRFEKSNKKILNFDFSSSAYWLKFSFQNNTSDSLQLILAQALLPTADLYYKNESDIWRCIKAGFEVKLDNKPVRHHLQIYPLSNRNKEYYLRLVSFSPPVLVSIWKTAAYEIKSTDQNLFHGIYTGMLMFVILYNLFLFLSLRIFNYLHYATIVFTYLIISGSVMDGYILYFFPNADLTFLYTFLPAVSTVNITLYSLLFLQIKKFVPRIYKFSVGACIYFAAYLFLQYFLPLEVKLIANQIHAMFVLGFMFFVGITAGNNGNKMGYYFAAAYFIYFAIVLVEIVYIQTGKPRYIFELSHVSIAIFIEAILLTFLLTKRLSWEEEEMRMAKEEAQANLIKRTQENEQFAHDQNIILEKTVRQRTHEIEQQKELVEHTLGEKESLLLEKETLLREIHHRVKNNLQVISSMLMLQSMSIKDDEAKKAIIESQNRVGSIALVHQRLYQNDGFERMELNAFTNDLAHRIMSVYFDQSTRISIRNKIPQTYLLIDEAIPLGLIFNELLTNSFKYAFNGNEKGEIKIELNHIHFDGHENGNSSKTKKVRLSYWDSGPGLESNGQLDQASTLGLKLVKLLSQQIGATLSYSKVNGSEFIITFDLTP